MKMKRTVFVIRKTVPYVDFAVLFKAIEYRDERVAPKLEFQ
jgi:hypothetical protein